MVDSCPLIVAGEKVDRTAVVALHRLLHCLAAVRDDDGMVFFVWRIVF